MASCVQIPRAIGAFYHVWKWHNVQRARSENAPLNYSRSLPIHVMTTGPFPAPSKCKSGLQRITGTCPGWWKQSFRLRLWSLVWFQVRASSCHLTSSKSAWKSTPKCTWMCSRLWWSPGAIGWTVADPTTRTKRPRLDFRRSATSLYPSLTGPSPTPIWTRWTTSFGHTARNITNMISHNTKASLIAAIRRVFTELPPGLVEKACSQFRICINALIEAEGGYME